MLAHSDFSRAAPKPFYRTLYAQVLAALVLGAIIGWIFPGFATSDWIKALGDGFVKLIKMMIALIIFCTVVSGISGVNDAKKVGRIGGKAILYFEIVSTFALMIGLLIGNIAGPGIGFTGKAPDAAAVASYSKQAGEQHGVDFVLNIIPDSVIGAFAKGDILQVLLVSVLFGFALMYLGDKGRVVKNFINDSSHVIFAIVAIIMKAAPIGAFGAMCYTVGKYGPQSLASLGYLILIFYLTAASFIIVVLGLIARIAGFNIS
jgi:aerobic C4-dicarboxylate transport protein